MIENSKKGIEYANQFDDVISETKQARKRKVVVLLRWIVTGAYAAAL